MGFLDKIKGIINGAKEKIAEKQEEERQRQEEERERERQRQEEERRKQEEANRFNPDEKSFEWFGSEDGLKTYGDYITVQNYLLEEKAKKKHEEEYSKYDYEVFVSVFYKEAKLPSVYFRNLVNSIDVQALKFVGPTNFLTNVLGIQAKPFYIDDDGEPQPSVREITPAELVSIEENPVLKFVKKFDCFELSDDDQGSWGDKYDLWMSIVIWLALYDGDKNIISDHPWIFSKELYFNELGTVRKSKSFYKKCMELTTNEKYKKYFEEKYNDCK